MHSKTRHKEKFKHTKLDHGLVASPNVYQGVRLEHVVDFVAGAVFVQSAHNAIDFMTLYKKIK